MKARAHVDGACANGIAAYGARLGFPDTGELVEFYGFVGEGITNNVAEYAAVIAVLELAITRGVTNLHISSDSQLIVRQLCGGYRVVHPNMIPLHARAKELAAKVPVVVFAWCRREQNKRADQLSKMGLQTRESVVFLPHLTGREKGFR